MKVSDALLLEATALVQSKDLSEQMQRVVACGCFGCGLGCSGTVGMD
ncbi:MAG: hypothetical protein LBK12_05880 [Odoribacteraceae bacterium]|nr:hypothetical protein [Odoribacteraceae bacterium]